MKSKIWSILCIIAAVVGFCASLASFLTAAIIGKTVMADAVTYNFILGGAGIVFGVLSIIFGGIKTPVKRSLVNGLMNLAKIGMMICVIVIAATFANM